MRWLMDCYCYFVVWSLDWLLGSSEVCTDTYTEGEMELKWYLCFRCRADLLGTVTTIRVEDEPCDAVLACNEHVAESLAERRHGLRPNEWIRAKPCASRTDEKFAAILNDAVTNRIEEFEKFMRLERVAQTRKEV